MPAQVSTENCSGCGDCVAACPTEAVKLDREKAAVDRELCIDCNACVDTCSSSAMAMAD